MSLLQLVQTSSFWLQHVSCAHPSAAVKTCPALCPNLPCHRALSLLRPQVLCSSLDQHGLQVLNLRNAAKAPLLTSLHAALSAARSTSFLSAFVGLYQMTISAHRALCRTGDFKLLYFVAGLCALPVRRAPAGCSRSPPRGMCSWPQSRLHGRSAQRLRIGRPDCPVTCLGAKRQPARPLPAPDFNHSSHLPAGLVASGSILMEKRSRRSELALYVFPRALDSFLLTVTPRGWVPSLRYGEVALFSLCMGALMYYRCEGGCFARP